MKRFLLSLLVLLAIAPSGHAYFPDYYPEPNEQFHPRHHDYYDDNLRLQRKKRSDIEHASQPTTHYDKEAQDYYRCDWGYNKNLGSWACNKNYASRNQQAESIPICPYGYQLNPWQTGCDKVQIPLNAHLNQMGNGWDCIEGYRKNSAYTACEPLQATHEFQVAQYTEPVEIIRYVYIEDETPDPQPELKKPVRLAQTGPHFGFLMMNSLFSFAFIKFKPLLNINR